VTYFAQFDSLMGHIITLKNSGGYSKIDC
jgi:hypothetical protein